METIELKNNKELLQEFNELKKTFGYGERIPLFNLKFKKTYAALQDYYNKRDKFLNKLCLLEKMINLGNEMQKRGMQKVFEFEWGGDYVANDVYEGNAIVICFLSGENRITITSECEYVDKLVYQDDDGEDRIRYEIKDYFLENFAYLNLEIKKCRIILKQYENDFVNQWL